MKTKKFIFLILFCITGFFPGKGGTDLYAESFFRKRLVKSDTTELNRQIRAAFEAVNKPEIMKAHIDTAELICNKSNIEITPLLHLARAQYFSGVNDFRDALTEANIAVKLAKNSKDDEALAKTYTYLGYYYLKTRMFNEGIDNFLNSVETARKAKLKGIIPAAYYGLSNLHFETGSIEKQRNTLLLALTSAEKEKDSITLNRTYYELGSSYADKNPVDHVLADSLLKTAFRIAFIRKDKNLLALSLDNLGWNSYLTQKYDDAIRYYEQSLKISLPELNHGASANAYGNLGTIYRDLGKHDLAIKYYKLSIDQSKPINYIYNLAWVYKDMSDMYLMKADTGRAYTFLVKHKEYSDKQLSTTNSTGLLQAKLRYDAETQKKEVELLSLRVNNQRLIIFGSIGLLVLSVTILILLLSRAKILAKRKISEMNRKIAEVTQANLRQQMNPHFIFNTLNSIQYYMYQHDKLSTNNYLTKFSSLMRKVLENSQHTSVPLQDELDALSLYLELEKIRFKDKFDYIIDLDEEIDPIMYKIPTMLIQPYVENSICHGLVPSSEKGLIKIDLKLKKNYISCVIEDNGIGREASGNRKKNQNGNHHSIGTQIVKSRLDLVNSLYGTNLKTIYTDLKNEKGEPEGTKVEIHIPILT